MEKFKLNIQDEQKNEWIEFLEIPIRKEVSEVKEFEIADGKRVVVAKGGIASDTILLGYGNGDGVANPGESIVLLVKDGGKLWRTNLHFSDPFVNPFGVNTRKSDSWGNYDNVGASAKYHIPLISSDCPENHPIDFFVEYWLPQKPLHIIKQGKIRIEVKGKDKTAPKLRWIQVPGDNVIQVKAIDGSKILSIKATLTSTKDPSKTLVINLKDDGVASDSYNADHVFSYQIPEQGFGLYSAVVEMLDSYGNTSIEKWPGEFVIY